MVPMAKLWAPDDSDYYSHILLIPFVSAYFLFEERKKDLWQTGEIFLFGVAVTAGGTASLWGRFVAKRLAGPE